MDDSGVVSNTKSYFDNKFSTGFNKLNGSMIIKPSELRNYIRKLKINKAPGADNLNNRLIKNLPRKAIVFLTQLFNSCYRLSYFPNKWKIARVIPIHKSGKDRTSVNSYRPISLLSSLGKLFERSILNRLNQFIVSNNVLPKEQFGFRDEHSTTHQLNRLTNTIKNNLSNKLSTGLLLFDIEKAFDRVWHNGLIYKMIILNFPAYIIKIIESFISNRFFFLSIDDKTSTFRSVISGVPQGAVLSPTLYSIFTADIQSIFRVDSDYALYADDTAIYTSSSCPDTIINTLQHNIDALIDYCQKWHINLNCEKTQAIFFTRRRAARYLPNNNILKVNDSVIQWNESVKYLGINLDKKLTFKNHVDLVIEKSQRIIKMLYSLINKRSNLSKKSKLLLYTSVIRPTITYGFPAWSFCANSHRIKLQIIQNKCLKIIHGKPRYFSTRRLHIMSNVSSINDYLNHINTHFQFNCRHHTNSLISGLSP